MQLRPVIIQNLSDVYKNNVKYRQNSKISLFLFEKPVPKPAKLYQIL